MEHEKHRTCKNCGGPLPSRRGRADEWDCPACSAARWERFRTHLLKAVFWGGVTALAFFIILNWEHPDNMSLSFFAFVWVFATLIWVIAAFIFIYPVVGSFGNGGNGGGWGNGGGGNGGG